MRKIIFPSDTAYLLPDARHIDKFNVFIAVDATSMDIN